MFFDIFFNRLKILIRSKSLIFWTLIFPLILATFFNLAFSNVTKNEKFKIINLAVVDNDNYRDEINFNNLIEKLSNQDDNQIFSTKYVTEESAKELLLNNEVSGYIVVKDKIEVVINSNGADQSTIKNIVDNYYQQMSVVNNIYKHNPELIESGVLDNLYEQTTNFKNISNNNVDPIALVFYTLIGMVCLYGGIFGVNAVIETEANLSKRGARISISKVHKLKVLLASLLAAFIIHYTEVLLLLIYLMLVLKVSFGTETLLILLITFMGSLAGTSFGVFIGASNKKDESKKTSILIAITMLFCFLSGMMMLQMKYIIANKFPLLAMINPVNMITDGLYSLYYYDTLDKYLYNIVSLIVFIITMIAASYVFIRRKKYDSI